MKKYVMFLRGINIGGNNRVPMAKLKECLESLGLRKIKTYLNSGNVVFSADEADVDSLRKQVEILLKNQFGFYIPVFILLQEELKDILQHAPDWWNSGNREVYDNLIFILPPVSFPEVFYVIGAPKEGLEKIQNYKNAVFWSFSRKDYQKTNWWPKTAGTYIGRSLTIRTAKTVRKLSE